MCRFELTVTYDIYDIQPWWSFNTELFLLCLELRRFCRHAHVKDSFNVQKCSVYFITF